MSSNSGALRARRGSYFIALAAAAAPLIATGADLSSVQVTAQRGQSADQARRDRYECHNFAIEQTGTAPLQVAPPQEVAEDRAERAARVIGGAATGAAIGGLVQSANHNDVADGIFAGAVIGAVIGTLTARKTKADEPDPAFDDYFRALSACLTGRGYSVNLPAAE